MAATVGAVLALPVLLGMQKKDVSAGRGSVQKPNLLLHIFAPLIGAGLNMLIAFLMRQSSVYRVFSNEVQESLMMAPLLLRIAGIGLIVPVAEELAYRGLLYPRMKKMMPRFAAILLSAFCFGLGHGNMIQFLYAFPMGVILCIFLDIRGSTIAVPILIHAGANLLTVLFFG